MDRLERQKKLDQALEALRKLDTSFKPRESPAPVYTAYHKAAAVLSDFELGTIKPAGPTSEPHAIERLMADSNTSSDRKGRQRWTLTPEVRRLVLQQMGKRTTLLQALEANPKRPNDVMQKMLEGYLFENAPSHLAQSVKELTSSLQIVAWFKGIEGFKKPLPSEKDVRSRLEWLNLLEPFEKLAGQHFRGRVKELDQLRTYVGVLPPVSLLAGLKNRVLNIRSLDEKPPLMIHGPGGMGKSTLVAKFILDHAKLDRPARFPFTYIDFDRPGLLASEPVTLLIEIVRQLGIQYPDVEEACNRVRQSWQADLGMAMQRAGNKKPAVPKRELSRFLTDFRNLLQTMGLEKEPFLFVLDTFEEVQYRSHRSIAGLWAFLNKFQSIVPRLRTVLSGRALLKDFKTEGLKLTNLDDDAAQGFLTVQKVEPESLIKTIVRITKGNPLSLRFAVTVFQKEGAASETFFESLKKERIQGELYARILSHMDQEDPDVINLAHPGFVLRRITPELILNVLAEPCGIKVTSLKRAKQLFNKLSQEITLVVPTEDGALRHQPEVRLIMLDLLRNDKSDKVTEISERAIAFYQNFDDPISRAEEIYHRLSLSQDFAIISERWIDGVGDHLYNAVEELNVRAQIFLGPRLEITFDESRLEDLSQEDWEIAVEQLVNDAVLMRDFEKAMKLLAQRPTRLPASPLYLLDARVHAVQDDWHAASDAIERGLYSFELKDPSPLLISFLRMQAAIVIRLRRYEEARESLYRAIRVARDYNDQIQLLFILLDLSLLTRLILTEAGTTDSPRNSEELSAVRQELAVVFGAAPDELFVEQTDLVRQIIGELGADDVTALVRCVKLVGLDSATPSQRRALARALALWDLNLSGEAGVDTGILARSSGILAGSAGVSYQGEMSEAWSAFLKTSSPKNITDTISSLLTSYDPPEPVRTSLLNILSSPGADDESAESIGSGSSAADERGTDRKGVSSEPGPDLRLTASQRQSFANALLNAFDRNSLALMLYSRLDIRIDTISLTDTWTSTVFLVLQTAERQGWLGRLLTAALESNPGNPHLREFAHQVGMTPDAQIKSPALEAFLKTSPGFLDATQWRARLGEIENRVCRVEVTIDDGRMVHGTGFLVGPDLLLTSFHIIRNVINNRGRTQIILRFDYKMLPDSTIVSRGTIFRLADKDWLVDYDGLTEQSSNLRDRTTSLDYALLRVEGMPGQEPVGGDRAEPGATPRGWIPLSKGSKHATRGEQLVIVHHPLGQPLKIAFGSIIDVEDAVMYHDAAIEPGSGGAPCFNSNWELVGIHQGLGESAKAPHSISIEAILTLLEKRGKGYLFGVDHFQATILRAHRVFINRHSLKSSVRELTRPGGSRVLVVNGPRGSGKTYTREFIFSIAEKIPGNKTLYVQFDAFDLSSPFDLTSIIAEQMGRSQQSIPIQGDEGAARWIQRLARWIIAGVINTNSEWWFIFDGFQNVKLGPTMRDLVEELVVQAETNIQQLRIVLLGYTEALPLQIERFVLKEELKPIQRVDVEEFFRETLIGDNEYNQTTDISRLVSDISLQVDHDVAASPVGEESRTRYLNEAVSAVLRSLRTSRS